jgi:hypothetical protein
MNTRNSIALAKLKRIGLLGTTLEGRLLAKVRLRRVTGKT